MSQNKDIPHADLIRSVLDGKEVEYKPSERGPWYGFNDAATAILYIVDYPEYQYRIKPEPVTKGQALEALIKRLRDYSEGGNPDKDSDLIDEAIEALQAVQVEPVEQMTDAQIHKGLHKDFPESSENMRLAYFAGVRFAEGRAALEAAQVEPVAWIEWDLEIDEGDPDSIVVQQTKPDLYAEGWDWKPLILATTTKDPS